MKTMRDAILAVMDLETVLATAAVKAMALGLSESEWEAVASHAWTGAVMGLGEKELGGVVPGQGRGDG